MCGDEKRESDVLVYHSLPILLRQGLYFSLGLTLSWIDWDQTSPRNFSVSVFHGAGVIGMWRMTGLLCGCWNLNSGPHDRRASVLSFELAPQPFSLSFLKNFPWSWRHGSKVRSTCSSCKEPKFDPQHPHGDLQPSVTPVPEDPAPSTDFLRYQTHMWHIDRCRQILIHIKSK